MLKHFEPFPCRSWDTAHHSKSWISQLTFAFHFPFHQSPRKCLCYAQILDSSCFKQHIFALCLLFSNHSSYMVQRCFLRYWNWWTGIPKAEITLVCVLDSSHLTLTYKTRNTNKIFQLQVTTFLLRYETNLKCFNVSCNLAARQQNSFAGKGLVHFSKNFWNNFFCWYESWQGTSFNLSVKNHSCKIWSFIFIGKLRTSGEKKVSQKQPWKQIL